MCDCNTDSKMGNYNALLFLTLYYHPKMHCSISRLPDRGMRLHAPRNASNRHVLELVFSCSQPLDYLTFFSTPLFLGSIYFSAYYLMYQVVENEEKTWNLFPSYYHCIYFGPSTALFQKAVYPFFPCLFY